MRPLLEREGGKRRMRGGYQEEKALCENKGGGRRCWERAGAELLFGPPAAACVFALERPGLLSRACLLLGEEDGGARRQLDPRRGGVGGAAASARRGRHEADVGAEGGRHRLCDKQRAERGLGI
eukprot:2840779-Pleurochrysis_carterae.AAC.1